MSIGAIGQGIAQAFSGYLSNERNRRRQMEDQQIDEHMSLIKALSDRPDANPALLGKALHDLVELQNAKAGGRKQKAGVEGFLGSSDLPISQFLDGISRGTTPIVGRTTEQVPKATGHAGMIQPKLMDMDLPGGKVSIPPMPEAPMPEVPSISYETRQAQNQPVLRSPDEMMEESARAASMKARLTKKGEIEGILGAAGDAGVKLSEQEHKGVVRRALGLPTFRSNSEQVVVQSPTGGETIVNAIFDPNTQSYTDENGLPLQVIRKAPVTPYRAPALVQMAAGQLGLDITAGIDHLNPTDAERLRTFVQSTEFDQFARRARMTHELAIAKAWAMPASPSASYQVGAPFGHSLGELAGRTALPSDVRQRVQATKGLMDFYDRVEGLTEKLLKSGGFWTRVGNTFKMNAAALQGDPDYRALQTEVKTNLANIARASGDVGNIAVQEAERYLAGLTNLGGFTHLADAQQQAMAGINSMREAAASRAAAQAGAQYDPQRHDPKTFMNQLFMQITPSSMVPDAPTRGPRNPRAVVNPLPEVGEEVIYKGKTYYFKGMDAQGNKLLSSTPIR